MGGRISWQSGGRRRGKWKRLNMHKFFKRFFIADARCETDFHYNSSFLERFWFLFRTTPQDIRCGIHSGFPYCCIAFFIVPWKLISLLGRDHCSNNILWSAYWTLKLLAGELYYNEARYIQCPICMIRGKFIRAKDCNCRYYDPFYSPTNNTE